jgi:DNA-binding SARP family transcriptional activator
MSMFPESERPTIKVSFFGRGEVFVDGEPLSFPYSKARSLFFALVESRRWSRNALREAIWGNEPTAGQNMRNALSTLRRILPPGFIEADRLMVRVSASYQLETDLDRPDNPGATGADGSSRSSSLRLFLDDPTMDGAWVEERREFYTEKFGGFVSFHGTE